MNLLTVLLELIGFRFFKYYFVPIRNRQLLVIEQKKVMVSIVLSRQSFWVGFWTSPTGFFFT